MSESDKIVESGSSSYSNEAKAIGLLVFMLFMLIGIPCFDIYLGEATIKEVSQTLGVDRETYVIIEYQENQVPVKLSKMIRLDYISFEEKDGGYRASSLVFGAGFSIEELLMELDMPAELQIEYLENSKEKFKVAVLDYLNSDSEYIQLN